MVTALAAFVSVRMSALATRKGHPAVLPPTMSQMSTAEQPNRPPYLFGLLLLLLGNFLFLLAWCFLTYQFYQASLKLPWFLKLLQTATVMSQRASYGIVAALIPQRRFVGLAWALGLGLINGLVQGEFLNLISAASGYTFSHERWQQQVAATADQTLAMFVLAQGFRFAFGWRLVTNDKQPRRNQFQLADVLEWTTSIAAWLAVNRLIALDLANMRDYAVQFLTMALILFPIALVATSQRGLSAASALVLCVWVSAVELFFYVMARFVDPSAFRYPWSLFFSMCFGDAAGSLLLPALNFWIIRRLGFQWTGRSS